MTLYWRNHDHGAKPPSTTASLFLSDERGGEASI